MRQYPEEKYFFLNVAQTIGQCRAVGPGADGRVISGTIMPKQVMFIFDGDKVPRLILGRECLLLQGFPISLKMLENPASARETYSENFLGDLAGNMVSTPVMLAAVMSTMAAVSWIPDEPETSSADEARSAEPDGADAATPATAPLETASASVSYTQPQSPANLARARVVHYGSFGRIRWSGRAPPAAGSVPHPPP